MANTKSAQKAMRQAERRTTRNQSARSAVRTYVKKAGEAVLGTTEDAAEVVRAAVRALDKAALKGIVHPNAAARRKARLMSRLHRLSVAASEPGPSAEVAAAEPKGRAGRTAGGRASASGARSAAGSTRTAASPTRKPAARKPSTRARE
jgi:small subunit ribosomal protein S20